MNVTELPTQAGPVVLNFVEGLDTARREQVGGKFINALTLPLRADATFHPLKGGEQFLVRYPATATVGGRTLFAGMDESAFITGVHAQAWSSFRSGGEQGFFESLKPYLVKRILEMLPNAVVRRQGDIWSVSLPGNFQNHLIDSAEVGCRRKFRRFLKGEGGPSSRPILNTNHVLTGRFIDNVSFRGICLGASIGTGILTAPDHAPLELLEGLYLFARTPNLQPVTEAERLVGFE